jgi:hypothetical protein
MSNLGRLTAAPPGVPDEVVEELRTAYMAVMTDADFLAEAEKLGLPVQPERGDVVAAMVKVALQQSSETVEIISAALNLEVPTVKVSSDLLSLQDRNSIVQFRSGDETVTAKISGSRTAILIDGAEADRMALEVGMICEIEFDPNHEENEPKVMECK